MARAQKPSPSLLEDFEDTAKAVFSLEKTELGHKKVPEGREDDGGPER